MTKPKPTLHPTCEALRNTRLRLGWTQRMLAEEIGVTQSTISEWETGASVPLVTSAERWAAALGCALIVAGVA